MKEKEFRKLVREEIKSILEDIPSETPSKKGDLISQIYQWIIQGDMEKAVTAMQNDPTLMKLANNVELLKKELIKRMSQDKGMMDLISQSIDNLRKQRNIK